MSRERRRHVRVQPLPDAQATAQRVPHVEGELLQVVDISLGGIKLWSQRGHIVTEGDELKLKLKLGRFDEFEVNAVVRYTKDGLHGIEFIEPEEVARKMLDGYVSDLCERG